MPSPESQRIRATFANTQPPSDAPIEAQRQEWEAAVEATNLQLDALVTPVDLDGIYGEWVTAGDSDAAGVLPCATRRCCISATSCRMTRASPLYADLRQLPALLIHAGDHEVLRSDATRLAEQAQAAGVVVQLEIWDSMWHV